jgi:hypothetical protein
MRKLLRLASRIEQILDQTSGKHLLQYVLHSTFPYFLERHFEGPVSDPFCGQKQTETDAEFLRHHTHC